MHQESQVEQTKAEPKVCDAFSVTVLTTKMRSYSWLNKNEKCEIFSSIATNVLGTF